jgi:hypothetical protein
MFLTFALGSLAITFVTLAVAFLVTAYLEVR